MVSLPLALAASLVGLFAAAFELVRERAIYRRERMVNLRLRTYLSSKLVVLIGFAALQVMALLVVVALAGAGYRLGDVQPVDRAGWTIDPNDRAALHAAVSEVFEQPDRVQEYSRNAQRLVRDRLAWDRIWLGAGLWFGLAGLALRDAELCDYAVNSRYGLKHLMAHDVRDDGLFWERSIGYHHFVIDALLPWTEAMLHCGVDLYRLEVPPDRVSAEDCAAMERHLEGCARCRGTCDSLKRTLALTTTYGDSRFHRRRVADALRSRDLERVP